MVDVSKCLKFHSNSFSCDHLLDTSIMHHYLNLCAEAGVQLDGLVTKCDRVITVLTFLKMEKKTDDHKRREIIDASIDRVTIWKRQWRKEKDRQRIQVGKDDGRSP